MSHHFDSPIAREDVRLDITDLYVFRGETGTVFVINVCHSIREPPTPGYHPEGMYEFKVDLNGDATEELTYRITFDERDSAGNQRFVLRQITGADAVDPNAPGEIIAEGITGQSVMTPKGVRIWAGKAGDPFWIEPDVLHAVGHALQDGTTINLSGWDPSKAKNLFAGHTVHAMVLEVPDDVLLTNAGSNRRIGVWAVSTLATDAGGWRSINLVGLPMIHPLFTQFNEDLGRPVGFSREEAAIYRPRSLGTALIRFGQWQGHSFPSPHPASASASQTHLPKARPLQKSSVADVRIGSLAGISHAVQACLLFDQKRTSGASERIVRFTPQGGHAQQRHQYLLSAISSPRLGCRTGSSALHPSSDQRSELLLSSRSGGPSSSRLPTPTH